jgi:HAD superfamily hydrolase (TIGR01549 family)
LTPTVLAVLFDVDFTLISPGPMFRAEGYEAVCAHHGITVEASRFDAAVASADVVFEQARDQPYDPEVFVAYTRHIIERMGGVDPGLDACAREICSEWAACHHFELFDEVPGVLRALSMEGVRIGLISNSQRCLDSFQAHFALQGLIDAAVSSPEHGFMKPHPSIFSVAAGRLGVHPAQILVVGDSIRDDIEGALRAGMRAALVYRSQTTHPRSAELAARGVAVIGSLNEIRPLLLRSI